MQGELRMWNGDNGDRQLRFDRRVYFPDLHQDTRDLNARLGARYSPSPSSDILASVIYQNRKFRDEFGDSNTGLIESHLDNRGMQYEWQYIYRQSGANLIAGVGYYDINRRFSQNITLLEETTGFNNIDGSVNQATAYLYSNFIVLPSLLATIGLNYDQYRQNPVGYPDVKARKLSKERINPKLGLRWQASKDVALRSAVYRTVNRALVSNQTLEPTQVAGFNQVYDALDGTDTWNYTVGLDMRLSTTIDFGIESLIRKINSFSFPIPHVATQQRDEGIYNGYLYWTLADEWAITGNVTFDTFEVSTNSRSLFPARVDTLSLPIAVRYLSPSGFYGDFGVSFIDQDVNIRSNDATNREEGHERFVSVDAGIGYRFPQRRGLISLQGRNLANQKFSYRDDNYRNPEIPFLTSLIPKRSIFVGMTMNF